MRVPVEPTHCCHGRLHAQHIVVMVVAAARAARLRIACGVVFMPAADPVGSRGRIGEKPSSPATSPAVAAAPCFGRVPLPSRPRRGRCTSSTGERGGACQRNGARCQRADRLCVEGLWAASSDVRPPSSCPYRLHRGARVHTKKKNPPGIQPGYTATPGRPHSPHNKKNKQPPSHTHVRHEPPRLRPPLRSLARLRGATPPSRPPGRAAAHVHHRAGRRGLQRPRVTPPSSPTGTESTAHKQDPGPHRTVPPSDRQQHSRQTPRRSVGPPVVHPFPPARQSRSPRTPNPASTARSRRAHLDRRAPPQTTHIGSRRC